MSQLQTKGSFIKPSDCVRFVNTAKNLGFRLDSCLNFKAQIKTLKSSCFNKLRKIAKMRPFLNIKGGVHPNYFVKLDFEIAVDQQTRARDRTFEGVPDSG